MWTQAPKTSPLNDLLLLDYATGSLSEAESLVVATHLALNPAARALVNDMEAIGGALLEDCHPADMTADCLDRVLNMLETLHEERPAGAAPPVPEAAGIPEPLRSYLDSNVLEQVGWHRMFRRITRHDIRMTTPTHRVRLMRLEPGAETPRHAHDGPELTLVLQGAYEDEHGAFRKGDLSIIADSAPHAPVACPEQGCICLTLTTAPLHMTSPVSRMVNAFLRF